MSTRNMPEWESEIQRSRTTLLNWLLLVTAVGAAPIALVLYYFSLSESKTWQERLINMIPFFIAWLAVLVAWLWKGMNYRARAGIMITVAYFLSALVFSRGGLTGSWSAWLLFPPTLAFVLLGPQSGVAVGTANILAYALIALAINQKWVVPQVATDLTTAQPLINEGVGFAFVAAVIMLLLWLFSRRWLEALRGASAANVQLQTRTRELEIANVQLNRQTSQLQATAEIAQASSSNLDPDALTKEVVEYNQEGFSPLGVYYVGLFLLDEAQEYAVLKAATGDAGKLLLEMNHELEVDETSTLGWSIVHQEARTALDLEEGSVQMDILPMPHTRSELALPLRSRNRILGALSVQSTHEAAFAEADVAILQTMADQVATAIDNARLLSQTRAALQEVQVAHRRYLVQAWREFLARRPISRVDYAQPGTEAGDGDLLRETQRAAVAHQRTVAAGSPSAGATSTPQAALVVPLKLRGQVIGTMSLHETRRQRPWTAEEVALAETIAEQVTLTVENLRLMDEAQRRVIRERAIREISDHMQRATSMEALMRITTEEVNQALSGDHTYVRLNETTPDQAPDDGQTSEGENRSAR